MDYYDKQGKPLTLHQWAQLFEDWEYKQIAKTELSNGLRISTVWLGANHNFGDGPPLIFETMVFGDPTEEPCERYATEDEARAGHERFVVEWSTT